MLRIYRYHSKACAEKLKRAFKKLAKPEQLRAIRGHTTCDCFIWLTGFTDTKTYERQPTGLRNWAQAEALKRSLEATAKDTAIHGRTLADAVQIFLDMQAPLIAPRTLSQYRLYLVNKLQCFAHSKNKYYMSELSVDLIEQFKTYALAGLASTTKANAVEKVKYFLSEAYRLEWLAEPLALRVKSVEAVYEEKQPYKEEEITKLLEEAGKLSGSRTGYATNGPTFRLLLELMLETGMRVSDAVRFDPARCIKSKRQWVYPFRPKKQRVNRVSKIVNAYLSENLKTAIDACTWFSTALPFAYRAPDVHLEKQEQACRERMAEIGTRCGVADCRPHRLRDSFAVRKLRKGVSMDDLSTMLGHASVTITRKYYAPWDSKRDERLELIAFKSRGGQSRSKA